ncbi:hypothetical protein L6R29_18185 [Myxococcota bacterium]|nr:hypothetical protein [Myxococcota bacterium]
MWYRWRGDGCLCAVWCWVVCWTVCGQAEAYSRRKTEAGVAVAWKRMPVRFVIDNRGMGDYFRNSPTRGAVGSELAAAQLAFDVWSKATCVGGKKTSLNFTDGGLVGGKKVGYDKACTDCNTNLIVFHSSQGSWPYDKLLIEQTTLSYDQNTGELFDIDTEINAEHYAFSTQTDNTEEMRYDLQSVLTFAVGRWVGLEEVKEAAFKESTMYTQLDQKDTNKRTLAEDDIGGVCAIYPPKATPNVPVYQQSEAFRDAGCSQIPPVFSWWWLVGVLGLFGWRKRRSCGYRMRVGSRWGERHDLHHCSMTNNRSF